MRIRMDRAPHMQLASLFTTSLGAPQCQSPQETEDIDQLIPQDSAYDVNRCASEVIRTLGHCLSPFVARGTVDVGMSAFQVRPTRGLTSHQALHIRHLAQRSGSRTEWASHCLPAIHILSPSLLPLADNPVQIPRRPEEHLPPAAHLPPPQLLLSALGAAAPQQGLHFLRCPRP